MKIKCSTPKHRAARAIFAINFSKEGQVSKLTKKQALELCAELWHWIAKQNKRHEGVGPKYWWPGFDRREIINACPCCEFAKDARGRVDCNKCPLLSTWKPDGVNVPCYSPKSPYLKWLNSTGKSASRYASIIAKASVREL